MVMVTLPRKTKQNTKQRGRGVGEVGRPYFSFFLSFCSPIAVDAIVL